MKIKRFFLALAAFVLAIVPLTTFAAAKSQQQVYVGPKEIINQNLYAAGDIVTIEGEVDGDVIAAGGSVRISGPVSGDVIVAGGELQILGPVQGNVRVAGGTVVIDSVIGKNLMVFGGDVELKSNAAVGWESLVFAGNADIRGAIQKTLRAFAGAMLIDAPIGGDVVARIGQPDGLIVSADSVIKGDLTYQAPTPATIVSGAEINGDENFTIVKADNNRIPVRQLLYTAGAAFLVVQLVALWIFGLVLIKLAPKFLEKAAKQVQADLWFNLAWGVLWSIISPVFIVVLAISIIGLPISIFLAAILTVTGLVGSIVSSLVVGKQLISWVTKKKFNAISHCQGLILGVFVMLLISLIPVFGSLLKYLIYALGFGAVLITVKKEKLIK